MLRTGTRTLVAAALAALCACSGGSDGGGDGGGLTVTPTTLTFTAVANGSFPATQYFDVKLPVGTAGVGYPQGSLPSWLSIGTVQATGSTVSLPVWVNATSPAGTHTATVTLVAVRADSSVIASRTVTVVYVVKGFWASPEAVTSSGVLGSSVAPPAKTVYVQGASARSWTATADQDWVHFATTGTTPSTVTLSFDPTGLATGTHHATVTFTSGSETAPVGVALTVATPTLTVTPATVQLAGLSGHDLSPKTVQVSLDTGTNAYSFGTSTSEAWIELAQTGTSASATPGTFTVTPAAAAAGWDAGGYAGSVTVTATVKGVPVSTRIAVSYRLDDVKLLGSHDGVALTSTPSLSRLSRTVELSTNRGTGFRWSAQSDQDWLTPTLAGTTGVDSLVLTADPYGLTTDTLNEATVTVISPDPAIVNSVAIRVGFWVGSVSPEPLTTVSVPYVDVASDPVRPYAYLTNGSSSIAVYDVFDAAQIGTITIPSATVYWITVSSDGSRLFALDVANDLIVPVDLATWTPGTAWSLPGNVSSWERIAYARPNGVPLIVSSYGTLHAPDTGTSYGSVAGFSTFSQPMPAASRDGSRVCAVSTGGAGYVLQCFALDATTLPGAASPIVTGPVSSRWASNVQAAVGYDLALSPDGTRVYVAGGSPSEFAIYDATTSATPRLGALAGAGTTTTIEVGADGRLYCGAAASPSSAWVYDAAGNLDATLAIGQITKKQLAVSGDALRIVILTGNKDTSTAVKFVTLP